MAAETDHTTESSMTFSEWCVRAAALVALADSPSDAYTRLLDDRQRGLEPPARVLAVLRDYIAHPADKESVLIRLALLGEISRQDRARDPEKPSCVEGLDLML